MKQLTITRPDDWHLHVRTGAILKTVIAHTAHQFARAIIMPNLRPPVTSVPQALAYREEIISAVPKNCDFIPLMTLYLTPSTTPEDIKQAAEAEFIQAIKLYPAGATTHSDAGIAKIQTIYPLLEAMQFHDLPLLIHGEVTDENCDIFDRERVFIDTILTKITQDFPALRIVLEHATTAEAIEFVKDAKPNIAATITPQHLMFNRNALFASGIRPHHYCLPVLKREHHKQALIQAATSANPKFFLGTDSAPHLTSLKESACGCAGCYSAHAAMELYTEVFELANALDRLEAFASFNGADFYRLPRNTSQITLAKMNWQVPDSYGENGNFITPLKAGENLSWKLIPSS
ncbi:MAG: dihydroorotase [Methylococcaceae bacterium]|jgi:dihydroorotase